MKHFINLLNEGTFVLRFSPRFHFHETLHWKYGHFLWPFWLKQSSLYWWRQMEEMTFLQTDHRHLRKRWGRCEGRSQLRGSRLGNISQVGRDLSLWSQVRSWVGVVWGCTVPCPSQWPLKLSLVKCLFSLCVYAPCWRTTGIWLRVWPHHGLWEYTSNSLESCMNDSKVVSVY